MVYYFTRTSSDGVKSVYVSESKDLARRLRREGSLVEFEAISLKDVEARVRFGEPKISTINDERYPNAIISEDVCLLKSYFEETTKISKLNGYNPTRVAWEENKQKLLRELAQLE